MVPFIRSIRLGWALRDALNEGYGKKQLVSDIQAGLIVGVVALPLAMALAIASGAAPQHGLYTVVIGGALCALLGGSRYQVTGPTAAFVVLLLPVVQQFGLSGLLVAGLLSGLLCIAYGVLRLGDIIQFVPHPVTTGFTSGIALVIASIQLKDFMGLTIVAPSSDFARRVYDVSLALPSLNVYEFAAGLATLGLLIFSGKKIKKVPAPIVALFTVTVGSVLLHRFWPDFDIATIAKRFNYIDHGQTLPGVPRGLPHFGWPWEAVNPGDAAFDFNWLHIKEIFPAAMAISLLGAIESLLSAVIADGMTQKKHNPNSELIALGISNVICPFFGGIPATGAIARTTTNIRFGAYSPIASVVHAGLVVLVLISLAPLVGYIPMAALAALLLFVAWNMSERHHFANILRIGSFEDRLVLLVCFGLTVIFDMTVGVGGGIVLSSTLFIRRIALATQGEFLTKAVPLSDQHSLPVPDNVLYYRISGPLFFGAAQRAMERFGNISTNVTTAVLDLSDVNVIDVTGLVALDSALRRLRELHLKVVIIAPHAITRKEISKLDVLKKAEPQFLQVVEGRGAALKLV